MFTPKSKLKFSMHELFSMENLKFMSGCCAKYIKHKNVFLTENNLASNRILKSGEYINTLQSCFKKIV